MPRNPISGSSPIVIPLRFVTSALLCLVIVSTRLVGAEPAPKATLQEVMAQAVKTSGLNVGVAIKDLTSGEEFLLKPDEVYPQGSSIRIHLVSELFRQAAAGKLSVDDVRHLPESAVTGGSGVLRYMRRSTVSMSLRDYAVLMIAANDHSAANFLTDLVGMDNVNASLAAQGTPEIKFRRRAISRRDAPNLPENEATPRAAMRALELLYRGQVVDRPTSDAILAVLAVTEVTYFRRQIPPNVPFAGRSGSGPTMRCDVGIVQLPGRPYILCVMVKDLHAVSEGIRDYAKADSLIAAITRAAHQHFSALAELNPLPKTKRKTDSEPPPSR
jgi:beta-lactamase class A